MVIINFHIKKKMIYRNVKKVWKQMPWFNEPGLCGFNIIIRLFAYLLWCFIWIISISIYFIIDTIKLIKLMPKIMNKAELLLSRQK